MKRVTLEFDGNATELKQQIQDLKPHADGIHVTPLSIDNLAREWVDKIKEQDTPSSWESNHFDTNRAPLDSGVFTVYYQEPTQNEESKRSHPPAIEKDELKDLCKRIIPTNRTKQIQLFNSIHFLQTTNHRAPTAQEQLGLQQRVNQHQLQQRTAKKRVFFTLLFSRLPVHSSLYSLMPEILSPSTTPTTVDPLLSIALPFRLQLAQNIRQCFPTRQQGGFTYFVFTTSLNISTVMAMASQWDQHSHTQYASPSFLITILTGFVALHQLPETVMNNVTHLIEGLYCTHQIMSLFSQSHRAPTQALILTLSKNTVQQFALLPRTLRNANAIKIIVNAVFALACAYCLPPEVALPTWLAPQLINTTLAIFNNTLAHNRLWTFPSELIPVFSLLLTDYINRQLSSSTDLLQNTSGNTEEQTSAQSAVTTPLLATLCSLSLSFLSQVASQTKQKLNFALCCRRRKSHSKTAHETATHHPSLIN